MRLLLIGLLVIALFVGSVFGTFTLLQHFDISGPPQSSGNTAKTTPIPAPPTAANPPAPVLPVIVPTATPNTPLSFSVTINKQQYRVGDVMALTASANQVCYLMLYDVDVQGTAARFFPNSDVGEPRLVPGEQRRIPGAGEEFDLSIAAPAGNGYIHAVCSWNPVEGMFEVYQTREALGAALRQHVYTLTIGQWVEAQIPYQIIR